jgi:hypothetical protein
MSGAGSPRPRQADGPLSDGLPGDLHTPIPALRIALKPAWALGRWDIRRLGTCPGCVADRRENQRRHIAEWRAANPETATPRLAEPWQPTAPGRQSRPRLASASCRVPERSAATGTRRHAVRPLRSGHPRGMTPHITLPGRTGHDHPLRGDQGLLAGLRRLFRGQFRGHALPCRAKVTVI